MGNIFKKHLNKIFSNKTSRLISIDNQLISLINSMNESYIKSTMLFTKQKQKNDEFILSLQQQIREQEIEIEKLKKEKAIEINKLKSDIISIALKKINNQDRSNKFNVYASSEGSKEYTVALILEKVDYKIRLGICPECDAEFRYNTL